MDGRKVRQRLFQSPSTPPPTLNRSHLMRPYLLCYLILLLCTCAHAQKTRWHINTNESGVVWNVANEAKLPHADKVEMSGRGVSAIIHYSVDTNHIVTVKRELIYPQIRTFIKDGDPEWWATYRNYLRRDYTDAEVLPGIEGVGGEAAFGPVDSISFYGHLTIHHAPTASGLRISRYFYPDGKKHAAYEMLVLRNESPTPLAVNLGARKGTKTQVGEQGEFKTAFGLASKFEGVLEPGGVSYNFVYYRAGKIDEDLTSASFDDAEMAFVMRRKLVADLLTKDLVLETPEPIYNTLFALSKVRGAESIFDSKLGLVHSPGGGRYYTGFWANDQAEYINPFFPYLGYDLGNDAALNMWRVYQKAIPEDGSNIRYSFEMAGEAPANPLDRGDAAMIAYGLSHYLLAKGDEAIARELWPLLTWCLDYNDRKLTKEGVVASESDEMEGRVETGDANLATSSLYYGALETSLSLARELGEEDFAKDLEKKRKNLAKAIDKFFGAKVQGLKTYRYYEGHENLRHWIALPLVVGLHDRKEATLTGLFDSLWTDNGVHVEKNHPDPKVSEIFWDRGTLYALRGAFIAGATSQAHDRLLQFSRERLLGERVPYVVEAYPEGEMAHLSAESGLYCRVFTEGLFGILPTGFRSFRLKPRMPEGWYKMALRNVHAFGSDEGFDVEVNRIGKEFTVRIKDSKGKVLKEGKVMRGEVMEIKLP